MHRLIPSLLLSLAITGTLSASVVMNSTESFDKAATGGAIWNVGGVDDFAGWKTNKINRDPNATATDRFFFGNDVQRNYGTAVGQPYPGSYSGAVGTLLVQHDCGWGNSTDPGTGQPYYPSSNMVTYISFNTVAGMTYKLSGWVNSIQNVVEPPVPPGRDGIHPIVVNAAYAGFPDIRIGLKEGLFNAATDFTGAWTAVTGLIDKTWVQTPTIEAIGTGGPMTIILQVKNPDTKAGANIMTDTSWDDISILEVPDPATWTLLTIGATALLRRRTRHA